MRITLLTLGTRGDIQPIVTLARRLGRDGHTAILSAPPDFANLAADYDVPFAPTGPWRERSWCEPSAERPPWTITAADGEQSERTMISGDKLQRLRYIYRRRRLRAQQYERDAWRVAQGSDAILFLAPGVVGYSIAERLGIPCAEIGIFPITRTRAFRSFLLGRGKDRGPFFNWLLWHLSERTWQLTQRTMTNRQRREVLGLPPLPLWDPFRRQALEGMPLYYAYSPTVLPRPADWPARVHVTGYYFSDPPPSWRPPSALVQFLRSGPAPVCIGFGSMPITAVERTLRVVLEALDLSGQRGILVSGWKSIGKGHHFSERVFRTEAIPHGWLFPRMAATVHHGGAGTTGAGLRSGVPSIVCPFASDQFGWGEVVHALGVGPAALPYERLTAGRLAGAIREATTNLAMRKRAAELGQRLQKEDGPGRTIELFLQYVDDWRAAA